MTKLKREAECCLAWSCHRTLHNWFPRMHPILTYREFRARAMRLLHD